MSGSNSPVLEEHNENSYLLEVPQDSEVYQAALPVATKDFLDYLKYTLMLCSNAVLVYGAYYIIMAYKKENNPAIQYSDGFLMAAGIVSSCSEIPMGVLSSDWWLEHLFRRTTLPLLWKRFSKNKISMMKDLLSFFLLRGLCSTMSVLHLFSTVRKADFHEQFREFAIFFYLLNYGSMLFFLMTKLIDKSYHFLLEKNAVWLLKLYNFGQLSDANLELQVVLTRLREMVVAQYPFLSLDEAIGDLFDAGDLTQDFRLAMIRSRLGRDADPAQAAGIRNAINQHYRNYYQWFYGASKQGYANRAKWWLGLIAACITAPAVFYTRMNAAADSFVLIEEIDFCSQNGFLQYLEKYGSALPSGIFAAYFSYSFFVDGCPYKLYEILLKPFLDVFCPDWTRSQYKKWFGPDYVSALGDHAGYWKKALFLLGCLLLLCYTGVNGFAAFILQSLIVSGTQKINNIFCNSSSTEAGLACNASSVKLFPCNSTSAQVAWLEVPYNGQTTTELFSNVGISILSLKIAIEFYEYIYDKAPFLIGMKHSDDQEIKRCISFVRLLSSCIDLLGRSLDSNVEQIGLSNQKRLKGEIRSFMDSEKFLRCLVNDYETMRRVGAVSRPNSENDEEESSVGSGSEALPMGTAPSVALAFGQLPLVATGALSPQTFRSVEYGPESHL